MTGGFVDGFEDVLDGVDSFDDPPVAPAVTDETSVHPPPVETSVEAPDDLDPDAVALVRRLFADGADGAEPNASGGAGVDATRAAGITTADGTVLALPDGIRLRIGRGAHADIRVDRAVVSRLHCLIDVDDGRASVVDLDSANGTVVDRDGRITAVGTRPVELHAGDRIATAGGAVMLALLEGRHE